MTTRVPQAGLSVFLNAIDLLVAFVLVLGGWNATNSHPSIGYACITLGPVLLYLSSGMWTKDRWKLIIRAAFYAGAFLFIGGGAAVLIGNQALPLGGRWVVYLGILALFVTFLLSLFHYWLVKRENPV